MRANAKSGANAGVAPSQPASSATQANTTLVNEAVGAGRAGDVKRGSPSASHSRSQPHHNSGSSSPHGRQTTPAQACQADPDAWVSDLLQANRQDKKYINSTSAEGRSASQSAPSSHAHDHHRDPVNYTTPSVARDATKQANTQGVMSMELLCKAYRLHLPCIAAHVPNHGTNANKSHGAVAGSDAVAGPLADSFGARGAADSATLSHVSDRRVASSNCEPCPSCLAGLQTLATSPATLENGVRAIMGSGPVIVQGSPAGADRLSAGAGAECEEETTSTSANSSNSNNDTSSAAAVALLPQVSLWRGLGNLGNTCYLNSVLQLLFAIAPLRRAVLVDGEEEEEEEAKGGKAQDSKMLALKSDDAAALSLTEEQTNNATSGRTLGTTANTCTTTTTTATPSAPEQLMLSSSAMAPTGVTAPAHESVVDDSLKASGLKEILAAMAYSRAGNTGVDAGPLARYLALDTSAQQDAQEFLLLLLDWLHSHCGQGVRRAIDTNLSWTLLFDRCCGCCGRSAKKAELLYTLSLPLRPTLHASLDQFLQPEEVEGFTCEQCRQTATATSRQYLRSLPNVLLIHLNHFVFDLQTLQRRKLTDAVSFPLLLDMTPYVQQWHQAKQQQQQQQQQQASSSPDAHSAASTTTSKVNLGKSYVYELRGIVNHHGDSAQSGHYTFDAKVPRLSCTNTSTSNASKNAVWLRFNDAETTELKGFGSSSSSSSSSSGTSSADTVSSKEAYILFYHRLDIPPPTTAVSTTTAVATVNSQGSTLLADSPTWHEFPARLLRAVSGHNAQALQERQAWQRRRHRLRHLLARWAAAAQALFTVLPPLTTLAQVNSHSAGEAVPPLYVLPTSWLAAFGRCFLPPYVHVHALAAPDITSNADEEEGGSSNNNSNNNGMMAPDSIISSARIAQCEANGDGGTGVTTGHEAAAAVLCSTSRRTSIAGITSSSTSLTGGVAGDLVTITQAAQRYALLKPSASLFCPHGKLAPWAAYKRVAPAAVPLLTAFFTECARAQQEQQQEQQQQQQQVQANETSGEKKPSTTNTTCAPVQPAALLALTRETLCAQCAASAARGVRVLAASCARDAAMQAALVAAKAEPSPSHLTSEKDAVIRDERVYVAETIVEAWEKFVATTTLSSAQRALVGQAGYTGLYALWRMQSPSSSSSQADTCGNNNNNNKSFACSTSSATFSEAARQASKPGAEGSKEKEESTRLVLPPQTALKPLHTLFAATMNTTSNSNSNSNSSASALQLLCPHGSLRVEAAVRVVPDSLRRFWCERFAQLLGLQTNSNMKDNSTTHADAAVVAATAASSTTISAAVSHEGSAAAPANQDGVDSLREPVTSEVERRWLPYLPVSRVHRCQLCIADSVHATVIRHRERLHKIEETRRFPTLWAAARLTSTQALSLLRAELQLDAEEQQQQLHQTRHPNVAFFKRPARESYREAVRRWREEQEREAGRRESYIAHLTRLAEKEKMLSIPIKVVAARRRGGGNNNTNNNNNNRNAGRGSPNVQDAQHALNENSAQARLQRAQEELRKLREEAPPAFEAAFGCIPTAWLAQWYRHIARNDTTTTTTTASATANATSTHTHPSVISNKSGVYEKDVSAGQAETVPVISYDALRCPHGGCLVEMAWLNPADGFWQGSRARRAELLWAAQAKKKKSNSNNDTASTTQETHTTNTCDDDEEEEEAALAWWPPLVIVPMAECVEVLRRYGPEDAVRTCVANATGTPRAEADAKAGDASEECVTYEVNREKVICALERHGERVLLPNPCELCCAEMLRAFDERCASFTNGTLQLQLHLRKSKKQFYDATSTLRSQPSITTSDATSSASVKQAQAGIHHFTTLGELKARIAEHIAEHHGFSVPAGELQLMRGRNRPLRYRRRDANTSPTTENACVEKAASPNKAAASSFPITTTTTTSTTAGTSQGEASVPDSATLFELDIRNGDTLTVNLTDAMAIPCALPSQHASKRGNNTSNAGGNARHYGRDRHTTSRKKGGKEGAEDEEEEVWETIPPELLAPQGNTEVERDATFAETKLHGHHATHKNTNNNNNNNNSSYYSRCEDSVGTRTQTGGGGGNGGPSSSYRRTSHTSASASHAAQEGRREAEEEEVTSGISCPVCTYLNAHGMVQCEMCETPLPRR